MKKLFSQLIKFGLVGGIAFLIDYGIMVFLTEVFKIPSLISAAISFTVSVIFNYIASVKWVFDVDKEKNSKTKELVVFILLSIVGLGINELIMWIMDKEFGIYYMISKIVATIVVMCYNFITRKLFLEKR
jgi:putative flippase GtrA